jgi:hypothetical protein
MDKKKLLVDESNQKPLWGGEEIHFQGANHGKVFLCLSHHHCSHPMKRYERIT